MPNEIELNQMEQTLIALGASVAAGCQPCTLYHMKAARTAGACDKGIALAVETALAGRQSATVAMDKWAERCQGARPEIDAEFRTRRRLSAELTSIAAAVAVNAVPDLQHHLVAARDLGAGVDQIRAAVEIARKIKRVAEDKIDTIAEGIEADAPQAAAITGAGCCGSTLAGRPEQARDVRPDCGCD